MEIDKSKLKRVKRNGVVAIIINKRRVLLLKRRNLPFLTNPGIWFFITGGRKNGEKYIETAYREIMEEVGIEKQMLRKLYECRVKLYDEAKKWIWENRCFIFYSKSRHVKLNIENSAYRWAGINDLRKEIGFSNILINKRFVINKIERFLNGSRSKA